MNTRLLIQIRHVFVAIATGLGAFIAVMGDPVVGAATIAASLGTLSHNSGDSHGH